MIFRIPPKPLSLSCCNKIRDLLEQKGLTQAEIEGFLKEVNDFLLRYARIETAWDKDPSTLEKVSREINALRNALKPRNPMTKAFLSFCYGVNNPLPPPYEEGEPELVPVEYPVGSGQVRHIDPRLLNVSEETRLMRPSMSGGVARPVQFSEHWGIMLAACVRADVEIDKMINDNRRGKGRLPDPKRYFVMHLLDIFQRWAEKSLKSSPVATINKILRLIIHDVAPKEERKNYRKLLITANSLRS